MRSLTTLSLLFFYQLLFLGVEGLVTLETIRNLTVETDECRDRIGGVPVGFGVEGQQIFGAEGNGSGKEDEEITIASAIRILNSDLLFYLERPLSSSPSELISEKQCPSITQEYHTFISSTVKLLHQIQEQQMFWRWGSDSVVVDALVWMQRLWASRGTNSQNRSFIEQQMSLYASTGCFGKSKEVLRRDVEVVEYMNDLIDMFD